MWIVKVQLQTPTPHETYSSGSLAFYAELWKNVQGENIFFIQS